MLNFDVDLDAKNGVQRNRNPMRAPVVGANAHPRLNASVNRFPIWRTWVGKVIYFCKWVAIVEMTGIHTHVRPYISEIGARNRGFIKIESVMF